MLVIVVPHLLLFDVFIILFFIHCFSTSSLTLPWAIARFLHWFLHFQPSSLQSDSWHFQFNLSGPFCYSFTASATDLRVFFTLRCFLPYTPSRHLAQPNFTKASLGAGSSPLKVTGPPTEVWNTDPTNLFVWITQCSPKVISR